MIQNKNHDLEVLRTIAIAFVFLAHIPGILSPNSFYWKIFDISRFGSGVDLFFCVSGFIVTKSLIGKKLHLMDFNSFIGEAKSFYVKRAWRLLPAAFFWIFISTLLYIAANAMAGNNDILKALKPAFFSLLQVQNIFYMSCRDEGTCGPLGIYWSLSLENQFYLLLPLMLFMFSNRKLCFFMFLVFLLQFFIPRTLNEQTPMAWPIRTDAIALGVIIAVMSTRENYAKTNPKTLKNGFFSLVFLTVSCFLLAIFTKPEPVVFFQVGLTAAISGLMVFVASYNKGYYARNKFIIKTCDYIGSRSYSLYLTHVLALLVTKGVLMRTGWVDSDLNTGIRLAFFFFLTFAMTEFSYRMIENKFRYYWKIKDKK
ncbi:acyltransferase family protein [Pantoea sp. FN060301]|uniref:acyltransferase family protein n=1 Tax=Pantoea sp. FN060301 TaxID=3420380 RepID=UPI003D176D08